MGKLEKMMKEQGWKFGRTENCGVEYWTFRKDGFEIALKDIAKINTLDNHDFGHFKKWREASSKL